VRGGEQATNRLVEEFPLIIVSRVTCINPASAPRYNNASVVFGGSPVCPSCRSLRYIFALVAPKQRRPAKPLPKEEYSWETQFSISNENWLQVYRDMQLALVRDLLVVDDHFQLRRGVITKARVIAAWGHRSPRK